jgi:hypothetical protein
MAAGIALGRVRPARRPQRRLKPLADAALRLLKPARPVLANLAAIPLHVAGLGCIDAAAFEGNAIAGLVVTGLSLIWLEHVIADEP